MCASETVLLIWTLAANMETAGELGSPVYSRRFILEVILTRCVSVFWGHMVHTQFAYDTVLSDSTTVFLMKKMVPFPLVRFFSGRLRPTPCDNSQPHSFAFALSQTGVSVLRRSLFG